jgi:HD-like signal output (HDOD) protein
MVPQRQHESVMPGRLRLHAPFGQLSAQQLIVAAGRARLKRFRDGEVVLARGSHDDNDYFLLDGRVSLIDADGNSRLVSSGSNDACGALASSRPCLYDVRALGPVVCARIARDDVQKLRELGKRDRVNGIEAIDSGHPPDLLRELRAELAADRLRLPSLPSIVVRVRAAVSDPNSDSRNVAGLLATDPALAAKILKIANSPLCRGAVAVDTLPEAVARIGLYTVSELVVCFSLKEVFKTEDAALRARFAEAVDLAVRTGATASALAARVAPALADRALIAGLLSNIGALPVLERAGAGGDAGGAERMEATLAEFAPRVGALICREWGLGPDLGEAVLHAGDWAYQGGADAPIAELIVCARYHALLGLGRGRDLPKPEDVPALRVLGPERDAQSSIDLIRDARSRVDALLAALR